MQQFSLISCALLLLIFGCNANAKRSLLQAGTANAIRMCIPLAETTPGILAACTQALSLANDAASGVRFTCVAGGSPTACMEAIASGTADLSSFGASDVYTAKTKYNLEPIVAELYNNGTEATEYYSVAVVPSSFCTANTTFADLRGKRSCHTGYRKTAGWVAPVGYLVDSSTAPVVSNDPTVQADATTVATFFSKVCAPRVTDDGPRKGGQPYQPLCTACSGDCSESDPYYDYSGTLRGLIEDACDVAFTKQDVPLSYASDGTTPQSWSTQPKSALRLLCPNGGCQAVENFAQCNLARVPSHAIVGAAALQTSELGRNIKAALSKAANNNPAFLAAATEVGGAPNFLFASGTTGIKSQDETFDQFFDQGIVSAFRGIEELEQAQTQAPSPTASAPTPAPITPATPGQYRICVPVPEGNQASFIQTCNAALQRANKQNVTFTCVAGGSARGCMQMIKDGGAELSKFGPSDVNVANRDYGLEPIVSEYYGGDVGNEYYSVAVVKKEFCDAGNVALESLKGKRSCHTGYRKTAGWFMPVGYLVESGVMKAVNSNPGVNADAESVAEFFSKTCAPRITEDGPTTDGKPWDPLCTACGGDCSESDPYYDYPGTLRGLMEDACDVAFTKHDTASVVARDGSSPEPWATLAKDDLFGVPMELQRTQEGARVKAALVEAGKDPQFVQAATQIDGAESFMLTSNTKSLEAVDGSFLDYFGTGTSQAYKGIEFLDEAPETSSGSGLSGGAIAGIVIGVAAAGAIVGVVGLVLYKRARGRYSAFEVDIGRPIHVPAGDAKF